MVDDEHGVVMVLTRVLTQAGHKVIGCSSGEEAQKHIEAGLRPDLLITDVILDGTNGKKVAALIQKASPETRVIFISGYPSLSVGDHPVLQKPFDLNELVELVDKALS